MVENLPIGVLADLLNTFVWSIPNGLPPVMQTQPLALPPTPTVSPTSSSTTSTSSPPNGKAKTKSRVSSPTRTYELNRNTYSDCEKKHFLDVAYENNWGTTVAANKFTRIWGKGPTRRMFYWWREQFKKEHEREQKVLDELRGRKTELTCELAGLTNNCKLLAERAQQCVSQIDAVDGEIAILISKRQKAFCSITGDPCIHGDGLQEEGSMTRKFTTPFNCDFCKMPFQKENTCYIHMRLCQTRFVGSTSPVSEEKSVVVDEQKPPFLNVELIQDNNNTDLTELAEQLIARLAACAAPEFLMPRV